MLTYLLSRKLQSILLRMVGNFIWLSLYISPISHTLSNAFETFLSAMQHCFLPNKVFEISTVVAIPVTGSCCSKSMLGTWQDDIDELKESSYSFGGYFLKKIYITIIIIK